MTGMGFGKLQVHFPPRDSYVEGAEALRRLAG